MNGSSYFQLMIHETKEYKNPLGEMYYRCTVFADYVYQDWYGVYLTRDEVIEGSTFGLDMCEKYGLSMINNNSNLSGSWDHANDWIAEEWLPRALRIQLKKLAHIVSPDIFTALSFEEMQQNIAGQILSKTFQDIKSAEDWLKE